MFREENLALTFATGNQFFDLDSFWVYVNSLSKLENVDKVIFTQEIPDSAINRLLGMDFHIEYFEECKDILIDRHLAFWKYLNEHGHKYKYIAICDSKDIFFQSNPFDWIGNDWKPRFEGIQGNKRFLEDFVILTSEGFRQSQSGFARIEDFEFQRDVPKRFFKDNSKRWVINGGFSMGTSNALMNHEFLLWSLSMKTIGRCTDQAALNYIMNFLEEDSCYSISHPFNDTLCLHGEGVKEELVKKPKVIENQFFNPYFDTNQPYCVVHQWDRLDEDLKECVLAHLS